MGSIIEKLRGKLPHIMMMFILSACSAANFDGTQESASSKSNSTPTADVLTPVDPVCEDGDNSSTEFVYPPFIGLDEPDVPANCDNGFEMSNLKNSAISIDSPGGSRRIKLAIDLATYRQPDDIRIVAVDRYGHRKLLLHTCRMRTWDLADPTGGTVRPPDETIRQFSLTLPAGTRSLQIDNRAATSPTYIRILGLCDFDRANPSLNLGSRWRLVD